jgi:nucleoside-diphosphate-sugar epimerase
MRVLLTGATGFVGSHMARALLTAGCEVAALIRPLASMHRLDGISDQIVLFRGDLADTLFVRSSLAEWRPEACIHLAWYAEPGKYLHALENISALTAGLALLEELIRANCAQVVMVGTCAEYDADRGLLREDAPTRPATIYAATKLSLSLIGQQIAAAAGINFVWARLFYLYGPAEDPRRAVPALIRALLSGETFQATLGEQVRDYLHVEDVAAALWTLVEQRASGVFNIASGVPVTMRQLMEAAGEILGRTELIQFGAVPYRAWDPMFICGDSGLLRATGWTPRYSLRDGLKQTIDWWQIASPLYPTQSWIKPQ